MTDALADSDPDAPAARSDPNNASSTDSDGPETGRWSRRFSRSSPSESSAPGSTTPGSSESRRSPERSGPGRVSAAWQRFIDMPVEGYITLFVVAACVIFVFVQLHPAKIFSDTTPAGGDMGAHVWAPAYLRDHLLTKGRLTGWTPDWYAGFPAFQFYMIIPSLAIALLSLVIPYGIAFKLVAISGCVSLPFCAYFFGRMARLPFPGPALMAVAGTLFLFDRSFSIYGGNIASTLAGEFAFSISLSFGLLFLGVLARGLETGRHRGWAALLLALCGLCHLIPLIFVAVCTVLWLVLRPGVGQLKYLITVGPVAMALTAFWMLPFYGRSGYMNDMGWEKIERYKDYLWDREKLDPQLVNVPDLKWVIALAAVGLLLSLVYRRRVGVFLALSAAVMALGFIYVPQTRLWNARLLPFYYLSLYLLAAVGVAELGRLLSALFARDVNRPVRAVAAITPVLGCLAALIMLAMSLQVMPGGHSEIDPTDGKTVYKWGPAGVISTKDRSFIDSWADWNFDGYEGWDNPVIKDAQGNPVIGPDGGVERGPATYKKSYPEYHDLMVEMKSIGATKGCGRAMWEHEEQHDRYGTPMALMLLPFWTDGCIGSMEGLYFEASTTTPYHFLDQDELSWAPSNAQRDLPYDPGPPSKAEFDIGIDHLQMMGVKYYMAINDNTKALADQNPSLSTIATSGPWTIYSVADSEVVTPLPYQPAVLTGQPTSGPRWQDTSVCWYEDPANWDVFLTDSGPADWQRLERKVPINEKESPTQKCSPPENWQWLTTGPGPELRAQKPITVSNVVTGDDTISFDVSEPGVPVLVKASYFPNWKVSGADGVYRSTPNFMVVVPTGTHVELHYGYTNLDILAYLITFVGIAGLVLLFRAKPVTVAPPWSFWGRAERPDLYPPASTDLRFDGNGFDQSAAAALAGVVPDLGYGYGYGGEPGPPVGPRGASPYGLDDPIDPFAPSGIGPVDPAGLADRDAPFSPTHIDADTTDRPGSTDLSDLGDPNWRDTAAPDERAFAQPDSPPERGSSPTGVDGSGGSVVGADDRPVGEDLGAGRDGGIDPEPAADGSE